MNDPEVRKLCTGVPLTSRDKTPGGREPVQGSLFGVCAEDAPPSRGPPSRPGPTVRALTLWQPWASLVAGGAKRVETRSWGTPYRGPLLIHAARRWDDDLADAMLAAREVLRLWAGLLLLSPACRAALDMPVAGTLGCVLAVCVLADCREMSGPPPDDTEAAFGTYGPGRYGWRLEDVRPLAVPVPCRGMQGLWTPPPEVARAATAQLQPSEGGEEVGDTPQSEGYGSDLLNRLRAGGRRYARSRGKS